MLLDEVERLRDELERGRRTPPEDKEPRGPGRQEDEPELATAPRFQGWLRKRFGSGDLGRRLDLRSLPRRRPAKFVFGLALLGALVFAGMSLGAQLAAPALDAEGPHANALLGPRAVRGLTFSVRGTTAHWKLDGIDVTTRTRAAEGRSVFPAGTLGDGEHRLAVTVHGGFPGASSTHRWRFTIDTTAPAIPLPSVVQVESGRPIRLAGST